MSQVRILALALAVAATGCNALGGIDPPVLDPCSDGSGGSCAAGTGGAGSGGATSTTASSGPSATTGMPTPVCGDGHIDPGEQCDDGNTSNGDGCSAECKVECTGVGLVTDPTTFHCYSIVAFQDAWSDAKTSCEKFGFHLATIGSQEELDFLNPHLPGHWWIDGVRHGNVYAWDDGEPWTFDAWKMPGGPMMDPKKSCVKLDGGKFDVDDCNAKMGYVCEREPAGT